ncbi:hypothetical protein ADEAN_000211000 [Angomonas deanei]|uniref:Uncharacterized protein n=1 Tax=Angomonas deanei TaxID=59799 RepID=A0A7G2C4W9_9TRYP|nr:hypothetical protein ADEAN_000211000 [Angomonas deanei]
MSDPSRCVRISLDIKTDELTTGKLFTAFSGYGMIELFGIDELESSFSNLLVQFQRMSSAEQLVQDLSKQSNGWKYAFLTPSPNVGSTVLLTSTKPFRSVNDFSQGGKYQEKHLTLPTNIGEPKWREFVSSELSKSVDIVKRRCIGEHVSCLAFSSSHDANNFISADQLRLAKEHHIFIQHIGEKSGVLSTSIDSLLNAFDTRDVQKGSLIEGYVIDVRHNGECSVYSGLVDKSAQTPSKGLILDTHTNFLKVTTGDRVWIRLVSMADKKAVLEKVNTQLSTLIKGSADGGASAKVVSADDSLKDRLKMILQKRAQPQTQEKSLQKVLCKFPDGLFPYSKMQVVIDRVADDGIRARCSSATVEEGSTTSFNLPVLIPPALVPQADWRSFAVPNEKMTVVLLYCVSIGDSLAALQGVASKLESDFRKSETLLTHNSPLSTVRVGQTVSGCLGRVVSHRDVGVAETTPHFPAYLLFNVNVTPSLLHTPMIVPQRSITALGGERDSETVSVVYSEVERHNGQYMVFIGQDTFKDMREKNEQSEKLLEDAHILSAKEKVACAVKELLEEQDAVANRKRERS